MQIVVVHLASILVDPALQVLTAALALVLAAVVQLVLAAAAQLVLKCCQMPVHDGSKDPEPLVAAAAHRF